MRILLLLIASAWLLSAQDSQQVLSAFVGYSTLKNSTSLTPEVKAEVERLSAQASAAGRAGKFADALKHLAHGTALMRGQAWTPDAALAAGLTLSASPALPEPGQPLKVLLTPVFGPDVPSDATLTGTLVLLPSVGDAPRTEVASLGKLAAKELVTPWSRTVTLPEVPNGPYRLRLELAGLTVPVEKTAALRVEKGLTAKMQMLRARVRQVENEVTSKGKANLASAVPSVAYLVSLYDLANAGEVNLARPDMRVDFRREIAGANAALAELEDGRDPFATRKGDLRRAYRSGVDNTLQPYRVFVPTAYDGTRDFPLVIALHGMGGNENTLFEVYGQGALKTAAERHGYLVATPKGRQPASMYQGPAEQDVLDVLAEMRRLYRVDPKRVYMTGHSMGGFGTWSIAMNHPGLFAGLAPIAGGGNPARMDRIRHIPQYVVHGDDDKTVAVDSSRRMVEAARKLGTDMTYVEVPAGSHNDVVVPQFEPIFAWFDRVGKPAPATPTITVP